MGLDGGRHRGAAALAAASLPACPPACLPGSLVCATSTFPPPPTPRHHHRRNVARGLEAGTLPQPPRPAQGMPPQQAAEVLAVGASHPTWLVQRWLAQYGPAATLALLKHNNM